MKRYVQAAFRLLGLEVRRLPRRVVPEAAATSTRFADAKVYVGCGDDVRPGYIGCDLRRSNAVSIQCNAWELSQHCNNLAEVYTRHMLEHLTFKEAVRALEDWYQCLQSGGRLEVVVPNIDFHIEQWRRADWTDASVDDARSDAAWSAAGFWGWQRQSDPGMNDYDKSYWDVHKSGYNQNSMTYLLRRIGYIIVDVSVQSDCHLVAIATRP